jgi:hypothetical protein
MMSNGMANNFYKGEGESTAEGCDDPTVLNYYIVDAHCTNVMDPVKSKFYCRLLGVIPCSDSFGTDVCTDEYAAKIKERNA